MKSGCGSMGVRYGIHTAIWTEGLSEEKIRRGQEIGKSVRKMAVLQQYEYTGAVDRETHRDIKIYENLVGYVEL